MKLFLGEFDHAIDDRGRITLPRKIRQELEGYEVVLSKGFDACVFAFDRQSWEREAARHLETPMTDDKGRNLRRYLFSAATTAEIDKLGRILLPAHLKEYAGIRTTLKVIGAGDHFEIWDALAWEVFQKSQPTS
jgi:MraZ protein